MNYIISFPHSGNTWVRYFVEYMSVKPTDGLIGRRNPNDVLQNPIIHPKPKGVAPGDGFVAKKGHSWFNCIKESDKVVVIVRDPIEVFIRFNQGKRELTDELFESQTSGDKDDYIGILDNFNNFEGGKELVYYEDLMKEEEPYKRINNLLELGTKDKLMSFFNKIEEHKKKSLSIYPDSKTKGVSNNKHNKGEFDHLYNNLEQRKPNLFNKYLKHYKKLVK